MHLPSGIDPTTHNTMSRCSTTELHPTPLPYKVVEHLSGGTPRDARLGSQSLVS